MSDDLTKLETWLTPLIQKLSTTERAALARKIGTALRRSQQQRIKDQQNPDGSPFAPRKAQQASGRIKRQAMFTKLRTAKHLRVSTTAAQVSVGFIGNVARVARIHQYGLRDRVRPGGPMAQYEQRQLLGFSAKDEDMIMDLVIKHLDI